VRFALVCLIACAPAIDGPVEHQRDRDRLDGARIEAELALLPGAAAARVVVHRAARDPLAVAEAPGVPTAAVLLVVDDAADRALLSATARVLVRAAVPEVAEPAIATVVAAPRTALASVGPFTVAASSRGPLRAVLAVALALIAALAGWIAWRARTIR
jgi:hypothetical protein